MQDEHICDVDAMGTPEGVIQAISFIVGFSDNEPAIVAALAAVLALYLRSAPPDMRGQIADQVLEHIRADVRQSLQ